MKRALLVAALALAAPAQESDSAELRGALEALRSGKPGQPAFEAAARHWPRLLASDASWFVAAAAHLSGEHGRVECIPALLLALERENQRPLEAAGLARPAILDALIRLDALVPARLLTQRLEPGALAETCLLLLRGSDNADGLLALHDAAAPDASARWAAACALVAARDRRIAARLLAGMEWELDVAVRDAGSALSIPRGVAGGGWSLAHERWPPVVGYELILPEEGAPLSSLAHTRKESARSGRLPEPVTAERRTALRARLLDALLGDAPEHGLPWPAQGLYLDWTDPATCSRALRERCLDFLERLARIADRLASAGLLERTPETSAALRLRVRRHDLRAGAVAPLPPPPALPGVVFEGP